MAQYADVLGPDKAQVLPRDAAGATGTPTTLVKDAHDEGLLVVPYTFRAENQFLPLQYRVEHRPERVRRPVRRDQDYLRAGVDGFFTDQPDLGVIARDDFLDR